MPISVSQPEAGLLSVRLPKLTLPDMALESVLDVDQVALDKDGTPILQFKFSRMLDINSVAFVDGADGAAFEINLELSDPVPAPEISVKPINRRPIKVAIDPGHGGADPGAIRGIDLEKNLVLIFAKEIELALLHNDKFEPFLVRVGDSFVSLDERRRRARVAGADVFLSFHADAIVEGQASGLTVYSLRPIEKGQLSDDLGRFDMPNVLLGDNANDAISEDSLTTLLEFGVADQRTASRKFSEVLVAELSKSLGTMRRRPNLDADFAVLKQTGMISILIELGFITNTRDLAQLKRQDWRADAIEGIISALDVWAEQLEAQNQ